MAQAPLAILATGVDDQMDCTTVHGLLNAYHDGELESSERDAVSAHLAQCPACRGELNEIRRIDDLFSSMVPPEAPAGDWDRVRALVGGSQIPIHESTPSRLRRMTAALLLVVLCGLALAIWSQPGWNILDRFAFADPVDLARDLNKTAAKSQGNQVDVKDICGLVDFQVLKVEELPGGYKLSDCLVDSACKVRYRYVRKDGEVVVLLYKPGHPVVHGSPMTFDVTIHGKAVKIAQCKNKRRLAASWEVSDTGVSLVGPTALDELVNLMVHVDNLLEGVK